MVFYDEVFVDLVAELCWECEEMAFSSGVLLSGKLFGTDAMDFAVASDECYSGFRDRFA